MRRSGILLHITSLPGSHGIGDLGADARRFVDALARAGQKAWQILPLNPVDGVGSPYSSSSSMACEPLLLSLGDLADEGLVDPSTLAPLEAAGRSLAEGVDYTGLMVRRRRLIRAQAMALADNPPGTLSGPFSAFCDREDPDWLDDYALFMALRGRLGRVAWQDWPAPLAWRETKALDEARTVLASDIAAVKMEQFLFDRQWRRLKDLANSRGIEIIGDMPLFVTGDSADVWASPHLFKLDNQGRPLTVAGVPPDYFSKTGQMWGNPVYDWDAMQADGMAFWTRRAGRLLSLVDRVRIDHFRGIQATWEIPAGAPDAVSGQWVTVPGRALLDALAAQRPGMPYIAEDLGYITWEVDTLRNWYGLPGMHVLQFAFGAGVPKAEDHPVNFIPRSICYTGTHDNATTVEWFTAVHDNADDAAQAQRERLAFLEVAGNTGQPHWDMIRLAMMSGSDLAVLPLQDIMGLGPEGRMNTPATGTGNWSWRFKWDDLSTADLDHLKDLTVAGGRA